ncbi:MAG: hypothetical protein QOD78_494, partial [Chloroflexota bacterium]|nr:hypothetical protein [Chloroflexota bacterium]
MRRNEGVDRRIQMWFDENAVGGMPDALLESILDSTRQRRSHPAWVVALRGGGMGGGVRLGGQPIRRVAYLLALAVLMLALIAAVLLAGGATRQLGGNGPIVFYRTDSARSTNTPFMVEPDGSHETALHDGGLVPGIWSADGAKLAITHLVTD